MSEFQLDTSGHVDIGPTKWPEGNCGRTATVRFEWSDLTPFTQGYVEALFAAHSIERFNGEQTFSHGAFDMLAPETLARIMEDCATEVARWATPRLATRHCGGEFWEGRQTGNFTGERAYLRPSPPTWATTTRSTCARPPTPPGRVGEWPAPTIGSARRWTGP